MPATPDPDPTERVLGVLRETGLVPLSDARLPSVTSLVAGAAVRGSWWSHPRAHEFFHVASALGEHPEVTAAKLVAAKVRPRARLEGVARRLEARCGARLRLPWESP